MEFGIYIVKKIKSQIEGDDWLVIIRVNSGLGNQMFQYAFYLSFIMKNKEAYLDTNWYKSNRIHNGFELKRIFNVDFNEANEELKREYGIFNSGKILYYFYKVFGKKTYKSINGSDAIKYIPDIYNFDNVYLDGYWQSPKFFSSIEETIRSIYSFPPILDANNKKWEEMENFTNSVSIHVRRGDYLADDFFSVCQEDYYNTAIKKIDAIVNNPTFFVFSDDMEWVRKHLKLTNAFYIDNNHGNNSYIDMQLMSKCKHNIIANSSFSWWGAWLNQNPEKKVVAPKLWFKNVYADDILDKDWITV